jgi:hypothetical protein
LRDYCRSVNEFFIPPGCYGALVGSWVLTFRNTHTVPFSNARQSKNTASSLNMGQITTNQLSVTSHSSEAHTANNMRKYNKIPPIKFNTDTTNFIESRLPVSRAYTFICNKLFSDVIRGRKVFRQGWHASL